MGDGAAHVADRGHEIGRKCFDFWQIIVFFTHEVADRGVRPPRLLWRCAGSPRAPEQFAVKTNERLEGFVGEPAHVSDLRQAESGVVHTLLGAFEFDLECAAAIGRFVTEESGERGVEFTRDGLEKREFWFASTVLDERELAGADADFGAELLEREARSRSVKANAFSSDEVIGIAKSVLECARRSHIFTIKQILQKLTTDFAGFASIGLRILKCSPGFHTMFDPELITNTVHGQRNQYLYEHC